MDCTITLEQRIRNGIAWLDAYGPRNWRTKITRAIKAKRLDLGHANHCVLGEVYGEYGAGLEALKLASGIQYGFERLSLRPGQTEHSESYNMLSETWKRLYREGQQQAMQARRKT